MHEGVPLAECNTDAQPSPTSNAPCSTNNDGQGETDLSAVADEWVCQARAVWGQLLGRDVGKSDTPRFIWKAPSSRRDQEKSFPDLVRASYWRSAGRTLAGLAAKIRKDPSLFRLIDHWAVVNQLDDDLRSADEVSHSESDIAKEKEWLASTKESLGEFARLDRLPPTPISKASAIALRMANAHEERYRKIVKDEARRNLEEGSTYVKRTNLRLPGAAAFRLLRGPAGWAKPMTGPSRYNDYREDDDDVTGVDDQLTDGQGDDDGSLSEHVLLAEQAEVDATADMWAALWKEGQEPFLPPQAIGDNHLELLNADDIKQAALSFPQGTGVGADNTSPRAIAALPYSMRAKLADILNRCEAEGRWPSRWQLVVIALLPKADGSRRPIGLFPAVIRVWMRSRSSALRSWEADHDHSSIYGSSGKAAKRATWLAAWEAESARSKEGLYAQALLDLAKAFDTVPHEQVWKQAAARGYPLHILRLALAAYRLPRTIGIDSVFSRLIVAGRGITAGSGTATAELRLLILGLLDALQIECPVASLAIYVDDINIEATSDDCGVTEAKNMTAVDKRFLQGCKMARVVATAVNAIVKYFEEDLGMEVSAPKSKITSSVPAAARLVQSLVRKSKAAAIS